MEAVKVSERNKTVYEDLKRWGPKMRITVYYALKTCYDRELLPAEFTQMKLKALYSEEYSGQAIRVHCDDEGKRHNESFLSGGADKRKAQL